jgi:hypothetical protein
MSNPTLLLLLHLCNLKGPQIDARHNKVVVAGDAHPFPQCVKLLSDCRCYSNGLLALASLLNHDWCGFGLLCPKFVLQNLTSTNYHNTPSP